MVHALDEIKRGLRPDGRMVDLRPVANRWPVEVITDSGSEVVGRLVDLPVVLADDAACEAALQRATNNGWFVLEKVVNFDFLYRWDSPEELKTYIDEEWQDYHELPEKDFERLRKSFKSAADTTRVGIRRKMHLGCWRNMKASLKLDQG